MRIVDALILIGLSFLSASSQFLFKKAAAQVVSHRGFWTFVRTLLNPHALIAGSILLFVPLAYIHVLQRVELIAAYPFMTLNYVFVLMGSHLFFRESILPKQWLGIGLILLGVLLTAY